MITRGSFAPYGPDLFRAASSRHVLQPNHLGRTGRLADWQGSRPLSGTLVTQFQIAIDQFQLCLAQASQLQFQRPLITQSACGPCGIQCPTQTVDQSFIQLRFRQSSLRFSHPLTSLKKYLLPTKQRSPRGCACPLPRQTAWPAQSGFPSIEWGHVCYGASCNSTSRRVWARTRRFWCRSTRTLHRRGLGHPYSVQK